MDRRTDIYTWTWFLFFQEEEGKSVLILNSWKSREQVVKDRGLEGWSWRRWMSSRMVRKKHEPLEWPSSTSTQLLALGSGKETVETCLQKKTSKDNDLWSFPFSLFWGTRVEEWYHLRFDKSTETLISLLPSSSSFSDPWPFRTLVALKDALDKRGTLNELKAKVRSEVFSAIDDTKVCNWHDAAT